MSSEGDTAWVGGLPDPDVPLSARGGGSVSGSCWDPVGSTNQMLPWGRQEAAASSLVPGAPVAIWVEPFPGTGGHSPCLGSPELPVSLQGWLLLSGCFLPRGNSMGECPPKRFPNPKPHPAPEHGCDGGRLIRLSPSCGALGTGRAAAASDEGGIWSWPYLCWGHIPAPVPAALHWRALPHRKGIHVSTVPPGRRPTPTCVLGEQLLWHFNPRTC